MKAGASAPAERWVVRCDDFTTKPLPSEAAASRLLEQVEQAGHCRLPHKVGRVDA